MSNSHAQYLFVSSQNRVIKGHTYPPTTKNYTELMPHKGRTGTRSGTGEYCKDRKPSGRLNADVPAATWPWATIRTRVTMFALSSFSRPQTAGL